jgi:hypothetical protein
MATKPSQPGMLHLVRQFAVDAKGDGPVSVMAKRISIVVADRTQRSSADRGLRHHRAAK